MSIMGYVEHLYGQGRADRTIREYHKWMRRLATWATERGLDLDQLDGRHLRTWADTTVPHTWASRKQAKTAVAGYYRMVGRADDPSAGIRVPRKPQPRPKPLGHEDATRVRDAALMVGGRAGLATIIGLYAAGRASELAVQRWDGVDERAGTLTWWRTKTSDWHTVPMAPTLAATLKQHRPMHAEGYIFVGNNGRPHVGSTTVWEWVKKVGRMAGVEVTPQQLRSTAGKRVLEVTGDLDAAASFLGHRDVNVTRAFYTGATEVERMQRAVGALDW